jgi:hypothetical protein
MLPTNIAMQLRGAHPPYCRLRLGWLWGVHRRSHLSSIVDPLHVTPRTHLVTIPSVVNVNCDTRSPIVVSFRPPRDAISMDPHYQRKRKRQ